MNIKLRQFILFLGDIALLYASLFIALSIRNQAIINGEVWQEHWPVFSIAFAIWLIVFYIAGVYSLSNIRNDLQSFITTSQAMGINILLAVSLFYIIPQTQLAPKTILLITGIIFFVLYIGWRRLMYQSISSKAFKRRVLIIGNNNAVAELTKILDNNPQYGYELAAVLSHDAKNQIGNLPDYADSEQLQTILKKHHISIVVMDKHSRDSGKLISNLYKHLDKRLEFISLSQFYEDITKKISLESIDQFWFLENLQEGKKRLYDVGKRTIDIFASVLGIIISIILMPLLSVTVLLTSGKPIFFTQIRLGKNGKPFKAIKFRTMVKDAEKHGPQWASQNDPRITPLGAFLRKSRLDEVPQLWNVLRGEMSFVGPRPERPEFVEELEKKIPFYRERLLVKPGITGWAQINYRYGASINDAIKKLQFDLYYVKNRSLILDLGVILKTIKTVLSFIGR
jgi:exopolysaccharide biosynthesis polyprenyl glycosylphosphotransferase